MRTRHAGAAAAGGDELRQLAAELVLEHGALIMRDAIKHSKSPADAEDAYQRSLEIMLTKAPTIDRDQLVPWLRTVVQGEARNIARRQHQLDVGLEDRHFEALPDRSLSPDFVAESFAELERGAEALGHLTADQVTCLIAQNDGLTYEVIVDLTGFTRRKVTRCLEHGRLALAKKVAAIANGSECERIEPLLHRLLDGDADAAIAVRPHLKHCLSCRARLREYEDAPKKLAALFPPAVVATGGDRLGLVDRVAQWWQAAGDRIAPFAIGADRWVEAGLVKKVGVVAMLATATAGTGAVVQQTVEGVQRGEQRVGAAEVQTPSKLVDTLRYERPAERRTAKHKRPSAPTPAPARPIAPPAPPPQTIDDGSAEFAPEGRGLEQ